MKKMILIQKWLDQEGLTAAELSRMCAVTPACTSKRRRNEFIMRSEMRAGVLWLVFNSPKALGTDIGCIAKSPKKPKKKRKI